MHKLRIILTIVLITGFVIGLALFLIGYLRPKEAGILVESNQTANVYIDGLLVGKTPYEGTRQPGEIIIKLVAASSDKSLVPFESKINLISGIKTIVRREFAETNDFSSSEIISFERTGGHESLLSVVSTPDSAQISLDGSIRGFTPLKSLASPGEHQLIVSRDGFVSKTISVVPAPGYKLIAVINLAKGEEIPETETPIEPKKKILVEILSTEVGFLRVRESPKDGTEVGQVKPGEKYPFLEEDPETGWYLIEIEASGTEQSRSGWVSNQFSKKIEELDGGDSAI